MPPLPLSRPPPNSRNAPELALEVLPPLRRRPLCIVSKGLFVKIVTSVNGTDLLRNRLLMAMAADTVAVTKVEFAITGKGISDALHRSAHRFVDGSLTGWRQIPRSQPAEWVLHLGERRPNPAGGRTAALTSR